MPQRIIVLFTLNTFLGIVYSQSKPFRVSSSVNVARSNASSSDSRDYEKNVQEWTKRMLSLSDSGGEELLNFKLSEQATPPMGSLSDAVLEGYGVLNSLFAFYQPFLTKRFLDEVPKAVVCILSGREDCSMEAELTRSLISQMETPLRSLLTSVRKQMCPTSIYSVRDSKTSVFLNVFHIEDSTVTRLASVQEFLMSSLIYMPQYLSDYLLPGWRVFIDVTFPPLVKYFSSVLVKLFQTPMDYIKIGLQFLIKPPVLNQSQQCYEGDLKQLIIWGMSHNVSWSFGDSVLDIFLTPEVPACDYQSLECHGGPAGPSPPLTRILEQAAEDPGALLDCERHRVVGPDTFCSELLTAEPEGSSTLLSFCQAMTALSDAQRVEMWRNGCLLVRSLLSSLTNESVCNGPFSSPFGPNGPRSPLSQPECSYKNWSSMSYVDPATVTLCSKNDRTEFVQAVCHNMILMHHLVAHVQNAWIWSFCSNVSSDHLVGLYCNYEPWRLKMVDTSLVSFCWDKDREALNRLLCDDLDFYMRFYAEPNNAWLSLSCESLEPPISLDVDAQVAGSCRYSDWSNPTLVTADVVQMCVQHDEVGFIRSVCSNSTFLPMLLENTLNWWLGDYCRTALGSLPTAPPTMLSKTDWCNYEEWGLKQVDPSVVGYCWQIDQINFHRNVCCITPMYDKLISDPLNHWLTAACSDRDMTDVAPQVCHYDDWDTPTVVDMTDLALCAELDQQNFTRWVCTNATVLQNLLTNLDNTWLLQYCSNSSGAVGVGKHQDNLLGFTPAEQCQYQSWTVALPDAALLALCWDYDQVNFVSTVCKDVHLLSLLGQEPSSVWVSDICPTYVNGQSNNAATAAAGGNSSASSSCITRDFVTKLNWSCSTDFSPACRPEAPWTVGLQLLLRCGVETLRPRLTGLLTKEVSSLMSQATTELVVLLLLLEERQVTSLRVTENIRLSVLDSIVAYLEQEADFNNKRVLLQCFGRLLTSLVQTGRDVSSDGNFLIKEYYRVPLPSLRAVLSAVDLSTAQQILLYYNRNRDSLQLSAHFLEAMASVFLQTLLARDENLFPELVNLLDWAKPTDILALPPLQDNSQVLNVISAKINSLSLEQRKAFGKWFGQSDNFLNTTAKNPTFITDTGNLIMYLPFYSFQHLSPAQLLDGMDVILSNPKDSFQEQFVAQKIVGAFTNLTANDFVRLGNLTCLAHPSDLLAYSNSEAFEVIRDNVRKCVQQGLGVPSELISSLFLNRAELKAPGSLSPDRIKELANFLPWLGVSFLRQLTSSQLRPALPQLASVPFTPTQAQQILDKVLSNSSLEDPEELLQLGGLLMGLRVETIWALPFDVLLTTLPDLALHGLSDAQANAVTTKLWGSVEVPRWLDEVMPLLSRTPLLNVIVRVPVLLSNHTSVQRRPWNTQQAKVLFKEAVKSKAKLSTADFITLGNVGHGVSCKALQQLFLAQPSSSSVHSILAFLRQQPVLLHTSLKRCIIEELYPFDFFSELLGELGSQIALELPLTTIKKFSVEMMDTLRQMIVDEPYHFLHLPATKQALLVDKMTQRLRMYTGQYTAEEFRSLGVMATFVMDEVFQQLDRTFFYENLEFLRDFCYRNTKRDLVAQFLQEPSTFGSVTNWTSETLDQVDRFIFFLPKEAIQKIPLVLMTQERIERLFLSQQKWEAQEVGSLCVQGSEAAELQTLFERRQFVLQFFKGFLTAGLQTTVPVPSCESLYVVQPSVWSLDSLTGMSVDAFTSCLELIGQDPFLSPYDLTQLLNKVKKIYGPVSTFPPSLVSQLGRMTLQLTEEELATLNLTELSAVAVVGAISGWNTRQLSVLFSSVLSSKKLLPSEMESSTLVSLGHIVCGIKPSVMRNLNPVEFSKAVLWLGCLRLSCSEEQLQVLVGLLSHSLAFGVISSWGPEVFIEIGALAAGLPDMAMSALVKDQIEGITPLAISLIPSKKFAVVFDQTQIRMFSYEQAVAVTAEQRDALSAVQKTALAMVLTPWEDKPIDFRGRSSDVSLHPGLLSPLLVLLLLLFRSWH